MTRKTPYKHPIHSHTRSGVTVQKYERGRGRPSPRAQPLNMKQHGSAQYNVTFYFSEGSETYNVGGGTLTGSLREAIPRIQRPEVPQHAQIRRTKR